MTKPVRNDSPQGIYLAKLSEKLWKTNKAQLVQMVKDLGWIDTTLVPIRKWSKQELIAAILDDSQQKYESRPQVIVASVSGNSINAIAYNGGAGGIRRYYKDAIDPRSLLNGIPPYFDNAETALAWMRENPGQICQIEVSAAVELGVQNDYD